MEKLRIRIIEGKYAGRTGYCYKAQYEKAKRLGRYIVWYSDEGIHPYQACMGFEQIELI